MAVIAPLRYLIVYPALTRQWERAWRSARRGCGHAVVIHAVASTVVRCG
jgi:hypothetical protein